MNFKNYISHVVILGAFAIISVLFFYPVLQGKALFQGDIANFRGMSQEIKTFRETNNEEPLWTNAMFGGMPAYQISTLYPSNLVYRFDKLLLGLLPQPANYVFLLMVGFFLAGLMVGANVWVSATLAIAFGFSSYSIIVIEAGHNSKVHAIAYFAPVLGAIIMTYNGRFLLGAALTALFLSLEIATNHLQITYYLLLTVLLLGLVKCIDMIVNGKIADFSKGTGVLIIAAALAVLPNITSLMATYEYGQYTMRGKSDLKKAAEKSTGLDKDYALGWSYGVAETGTILIPNFRGGASQQDVGVKSEVGKALKENGQPTSMVKQFTKSVPTYWGDQPFTSGPVYFGAAIIFLFVLGLLTLGTTDRWWILAATLLSIMLSWGKNWPPLTNLFFDYFPGYNKFRAVSMMLVIAQVVVPFLALLVVKKMTDSKPKFEDWKPKLLLSLYITAGLCLFFTLLPGALFSFDSPNDDQLKGSFPDWLLDAIITERENLLRWDAFRSLIIIGAAFGLLWFYTKEKISEVVLLGAFAVLFIFDLGGVDKRYVNGDSFVQKSRVEKPYQPTEADEFILQDKDPNFRVLNLSVNTFNDASTSYFHKSIGGYHGAKLKRYQELIDSCISRNNMGVLNMLNTKYVIIKDKASGGLRPQLNPEACGNAWFVKEIKLVANADAELNALSDSFNPLKTAIIDELFKDKVSNWKPNQDSTASIKLTEYKPNNLKYEYSTNVENLAVFSEIYYDKGWNAYVDGVLTPHFRANYVLRSMVLPAGKHTIEFKFEPNVYKTGEQIALAASILLLLVIGGSVFFEFRKKEL